MGHKTRKIVRRIIMAGNLLVIIIMLSVGHIDRLNPVNHPMLANLGLGFPILLVLNTGFLLIWIFFRRRLIWLPILGFLLCFGPIRKYIPFNLPKEKPHGSLKILSYNVFLFAPWNIPDGEPNPIIEYIIRSKADIVCLQEAGLQELREKDVLHRLATHYQYCDTTIKPVTRTECLMLLSRYPIIKKEIIPFNSKGNMTVAYLLNVRGIEMLVINNHLESYNLSSQDKEGFKSLIRRPLPTHSAKGESTYLLKKLGEASAKRAPEAEAVSKYVKGYLDRHIPVIVCGDFNDSPLSYVHRTMARGLTDAYISTGTGPGFSYHKSGMYVRIDHILCSPDLEPYEARVDDRVKRSDHYPIYCWLKYRPRI